MDPVSPGIGLVLGALAAAGGVYLAVRRPLAARGELRAELAAARDAAEERRAALAATETRLGEQQTELVRLREEQARLETRLEAEQRAAREKLAAWETAEERFREAFRSLSAEALGKNNRSFLDLARTQLEEFRKGASQDFEAKRKAVDELVKPIRESLQKVDTRIESVESARKEAYGALTEQVKAMALAQEQLKGETGKLIQALRQPHVRGNWGEIQLRRVAELAGMEAYCDFEEQVSVTGEDGALRPDMLVRLPGGKSVVVDAKTPLDAYLRAMEVGGEAACQAYLEEHARQVKAHMRVLAGKNYWSQFEASPEFVVMFLPGETFFSAALKADPTLIEYGVRQRVVLASPTTLIALLQAVAYGWRQETVAESARQVSALGKELYDRIRVLADHFLRLGKTLGQSVDNYNKAVGSLEGRVLTSARRFAEFGAGSGKEIPAAAPVETTPRALQADELLPAAADADALPEPDAPPSRPDADQD